MRLTDRDSLTVMKRELAEKPPRSNLVFDRDYQLVELAEDLRFTVVSPTFGAFSDYQFTIY